MDYRDMIILAGKMEKVNQLAKEIKAIERFRDGADAVGMYSRNSDQQFGGSITIKGDVAKKIIQEECTRMIQSRIDKIESIELNVKIVIE